MTNERAGAEITFESDVYGEFVWNRVGERDYVTRAGRRTIIAIWRAQCIFCGAAFEAATPVAADETRQSLAVRTCPRHRMTHSEASELRWAGTGNRARFEAIKREKLANDYQIE